MVCCRKCEIPGMSKGSGFRLWGDSGELQGMAFAAYINGVGKTECSDLLVWNEVISSPETLSSFLGNKINVLLIVKPGMRNWLKLHIFCFFFSFKQNSLPTPIYNKTVPSNTHVKTDSPLLAFDWPWLYIYCCVNIITPKKIREMWINSPVVGCAPHLC